MADCVTTDTRVYDQMVTGYKPSDKNFIASV